MNRGKELIEELQSVISGKTLDALVPPLLFVLLNNRLGLPLASLISGISALSLSLIRIFLKQRWQYAFGGLLGVLVASGFSYITGNASNFFLPGIISNVFLLLLILLSLLFDKPLAAWASHISRGWSLEWFWRPDIKPAYREVTWIWALLLLMRVVVLVVLFISGDVTRLFVWRTVLGWPLTIGVLLISYIYGIWRLHRLGGPGIEEFTSGKTPPYKGQTRGF